VVSRHEETIERVVLAILWGTGVGAVLILLISVGAIVAQGLGL
jgi:hypothetical protein